MVSMVASPKRSVAKKNGGQSFRACFTRKKVPPQVIATRMRPICAGNFLFTLLPQKYGRYTKGHIYVCRALKTSTDDFTADFISIGEKINRFR